MLSYKLLFFIPLISTLVTYPSGVFLGDRTAQFLSSALISLAAILSWILFIGYLTWWNGLKSLALDKSFRWDEWFWFGIVPALVPYVFYFIWKKKD